VRALHLAHDEHDRRAVRHRQHEYERVPVHLRVALAVTPAAVPKMTWNIFTLDEAK